jgi:hypothetical protein
MAALAVAVGLLTVLTLLNLFILLGVVRRLRTMAKDQEAASQPDLPEIGAPVGAFAVTATDGTVITEADLASGESMVLMLSPSCKPCKETAAKLAEDRTGLPERTYVLLRADEDEPGLADMLTLLTGVGTIARYDGTAGVELAFGSKAYPTTARVADGIVVAASTQYAEVLPTRVPA